MTIFFGYDPGGGNANGVACLRRDGGVTSAADLGAAGNLYIGLGVCSVVFIVTSLIASLIIPRRTQWFRTAIRVVGSWLAALGLLLIGWALHGDR